MQEFPPISPTTSQELILRTEEKSSDSKNSANPISKINHLLSILIRHKESTDDCSTQLFKQATHLLNSVNEEVKKKGPLGELVKNVAAQYEKFEEHLINSFGTQRLKDPVVFKDILCEKFDFERYSELKTLFYKETIQASPHPFANDILEWMDSLEKAFPVFVSQTTLINLKALESQKTVEKEVSNNEESKKGVHTLADLKKKEPLDPVSAFRDIQMYEKIIQNTHQSRSTLKFTAILQTENRLYQQKNEKILERGEEDSRRQQENFKQHTEWVLNSLENFKKNCDNRVQLTEEQLEEAKVLVKELQILLAQLKEENSANRNSISQLRSVIYNLQCQMGHLQNEVNNNDSFCTIF